jgi:hypothetical protein
VLLDERLKYGLFAGEVVIDPGDGAVSRFFRDVAHARRSVPFAEKEPFRCEQNLDTRLITFRHIRSLYERTIVHFPGIELIGMAVRWDGATISGRESNDSLVI